MLFSMSKTIYYIGAGASYGKRDKDGAILEGIPSLQRYIGESNPISVLFAPLCVAK